MRRLPGNRFRLLIATAVIAVGLGADAPGAQARDFFTSFFGALTGPPQQRQQPAFGFGNPGDAQYPQQAPAAASVGRSAAYCVRTCDGRYFPISVSGEQSKAESCRSLCPASETKVYYGSSIDNARNDSGKSYSSLPNAFKYREQLVNGCTCNGKDPLGLAAIDVKQDKTLRSGDIVAGENGLIVASRAGDARRGRVADFTPAPEDVRAKFERSHAMMHAPTRKRR